MYLPTLFFFAVLTTFNALFAAECPQGFTASVTDPHVCLRGGEQWVLHKSQWYRVFGRQNGKRLIANPVLVEDKELSTFTSSSRPAGSGQIPRSNFPLLQLPFSNGPQTAVTGITRVTLRTMLAFSSDGQIRPIRDVSLDFKPKFSAEQPISLPAGTQFEILWGGYLEVTNAEYGYSGILLVLSDPTGGQLEIGHHDKAIPRGINLFIRSKVGSVWVSALNSLFTFESWF